LQRISEEYTRNEMIDPQLEKAGWYVRELMVKVERQFEEPFESLLSEAFS
jgi:type I site-specific restriction endonuclease